MNTFEFEIWIGGLNELSTRQRSLLEGPMAGVGPSPEAAVIELVESKRAEQRQCPHCCGARLHAWGKANGLRRHRCADCRRTFNALTGTPLARLRHKARWLTHGAALKDGVSVRQAAEACEVAVSTAFRWRHRFLKAGKTTPPGTLSGIVEADETFFRRSFRGRGGGRRRSLKPPPRRASRASPIPAPANAARRSTRWCRC